MSEKDNEERYYTKGTEIYSVFRTLQSQHYAINIQFSPQGSFYNSLIVKADLEKKAIYLDEFVPREGHLKAVGKMPFSLHATLNGIKIHGKNLVVSNLHTDDSGILYRVPFPDKLLYLQRRDAYRVRVPSFMGLKVHCLSKSSNKTLVANVLNMSVTGFRMAIEGQPEPELEIAEEFDTNLAGVDDDQPLQCRVSVANVYYDKLKDATICGCNFIDLETPTQIKINRFVTHLQREEA